MSYSYARTTQKEKEKEKRKELMKVLTKILRKYPKNLLFAMISGSHVYGTSTEDSDYDIRGAFITPPEKKLGLDEFKENDTIQITYDGNLDVHLHEIGKFCQLLAKGNANIIGNLNSPYIKLHLLGKVEFLELKEISRFFITKNIKYHYLSMFENNYTHIANRHIPKKLLMMFRSLLSGSYALKYGSIEENINVLGIKFGYNYWIEKLKQENEAGGILDETKSRDYISFLRTTKDSLDRIAETSKLPTSPSRAAINELNRILLNIRKIVEQNNYKRPPEPD